MTNGTALKLTAKVLSSYGRYLIIPTIAVKIKNGKNLLRSCLKLYSLPLNFPDQIVNPNPAYDNNKLSKRI